MDETNLTKVTGTFKLCDRHNGYFYHMGEWVDMNGDGRKDFLTARSNAKKDEGYLVWFEHPAEGLTSNHWTEHIVTKGPDVGIQAVTVP